MRSCRSLLACLLLVPAGCGGGDSGVQTVPVSGTVTLDGQPLAGAMVRFEPTGAGGSTAEGWIDSSGITDAQGRYTLSTPDGMSGAVVGTHKVSITTAPPSGPVDFSTEGQTTAPAKEVIPARYNSQTELTFEVPKGGTDAANFDLTSK